MNDVATTAAPERLTIDDVLTALARLTLAASRRADELRDQGSEEAESWLQLAGYGHQIVIRAVSERQ